MQFVASIMMFLAFITACLAEVTLKRGVNQMVTVDGDKLLFEYSIPQTKYGEIGLCFGSSTYQSKACPQGYAGFFVLIDVPRETIKLSRSGVLTWTNARIQLLGVEFGEDNTLNVLLTEVPYGATVTLPNAYISVSTTTPTTLAPAKESSNKTVIILFVTILIIVVVIVGVAVWYFCFCRRKKDQTATVPEEQLPPNPKRTDQRIDNKKSGTRNHPSGITTTRTSTSTTKVPEGKPRIDQAPKPAPSAPMASSIHCVSIRPASTQGSISDSQIL